MKGILLCLILCLAAGEMTAQSKSILRMMEQDSALDLFLKLDWRELVNKKKDKLYLPANLRFVTSTGDSFAVDLQVRTRGHMRLDICYYPPLKMKFDKDELRARSLSTHNELDIVHHCENDPQYEQYILREYLAYKLFQVISPYHFRVQLIRLHYINPDGSKAYEPTLSFLVENAEELADNLNAKQYKTQVISRNAVERKSMIKVCLFEYMIGNTDWSVRNRHNLEYFVIPGYSLLVPVPFDFDYAGLVSAPYAAHHESIKLSSVAMRYYQGSCEPDEHVNAVIREFIEKKNELFTMCGKIQGMNERSVKHVREYLEEFFEIIENPKKTESHILRHCDMWPVE